MIYLYFHRSIRQIGSFGFLLSLVFSLESLPAATNDECRFHPRKSLPEVASLLEALPPEAGGLVTCAEKGASPEKPLSFFAFQTSGKSESQITDLLSSFARLVVEDRTGMVIKEQKTMSQGRSIVMEVTRGPTLKEPWFFYAFVTPVSGGKSAMFVIYASQSSQKSMNGRLQHFGWYLTRNGLTLVSAR